MSKTKNTGSRGDTANEKSRDPAILEWLRNVQYPHFDFIMYQTRQLGVYYLIFFLLFVINLIYNFYAGGTTLSLIVKVYLFVFAFFLIYNVTIAAPEEIILKYQGRTGRIFYIFESKLVPILVLYSMIAVYTLSDFVGEKGWPCSAVIRSLDGQHSNMIVYALILLYALKSRVTPLVTIPVFLALSYIYYRINISFYSEYTTGWPVILYKGSKLGAIFFLSIWDLTLKFRSALKRVVFALAASGITLAGAFTVYMVIYSMSQPGSYVWIETGKKLSKFGYHEPLSVIAREGARRKDVKIVHDVYRMMNFYNMHLEFDSEDWDNLLYQSDIEDADMTASFMLKEGVTGDVRQIAEYVQNSLSSDRNYSLNNLVTLCAKSCGSDEDVMYLLSRMESRDPGAYTLWIVHVLGETGSCLPVMPLVEKVFSIDSEIAESSYEALKSLTGMSPAEKAGVPFNSVETLREFKAFYQENCIAE